MCKTDKIGIMHSHYEEWAERECNRVGQSFYICIGGWEGGLKWDREIWGMDPLCHDGVLTPESNVV